MRNLIPLIFAMLLPALAMAEAVWIDVRTPEEHKKDHIAGDPLIPHENILTEVQKLLPNTGTEIHLYCRSGRRAGIAKAELEKAGYTKVSNAGGINAAREKRKR